MRNCGPPDLDGPDADRQRVGVHHLVGGEELDPEVVQVPLAGLPGVHVVDGERPGGAVGPRHLRATGIEQGDPHAGVSRRLDPVVDGAGGGRQTGDDRDVADVGRRRAVQPDRPVQPGVVEEVVEVGLAASARTVLHDARRHRRPGQAVVDDDGEPQLLTRSHVLGDVGLEGRVAAFVPGDLHVVDPDDGAVRGRVEPEHHPLIRPAPRHPDRGLVPGIAHVVAHRCVGRDVVVARRYRHLRASDSGPRHQPCSRPSPAASRRNCQSPFRLLRSRVGPS